MTSAEQPDREGGRRFEVSRAALHAVEPLQLDLLRRVRAEADQLAGVRKAVLSFAEACGVAKAAQADVVLAVGEACANVVMHAYVDDATPGWLTVEACHPDGELVVAVRDEGRGMRPRPDSPGLGLGLSIIGQLAQRLEIGANGACGTEVRMTFPTAG